jgi:outer membrane immunogenic protein
VTGGGAWSNLQAANYIETGPPCLPAPPSFLGCTTHSATFGGWTAGVGIEYALTQNWIVGAEYLYAGFGRIDFVYNGPTNVSESISQLRARVSFKF